MAYKTYNGVKLFSYDDSLDQVKKTPTKTTQQKSPNAFESFFNWIGDTAGAIGNTLKDTVGAIGSIGATTAANSLREKREQASKQRLDEIAKKYGFNSFNEISDEAWQNNQAMNDELKQATKENSDAANQASKAYKENWAVKNTANVKQGDYGANAIKTWNTLADVLTAPVSLPAGMAINAGQGYLSAIGDELQGKDVVMADPWGNSTNSSFDWGNVAKQGTANALAGVAGGAAGAGLGKAGSKLLGSNSKLAKGLGKLSNTGIVRGAVSGAAGGATGAGLGTAFEGGDLEQVLANAAAGARQGAGTGAVTGAGMSLLNAGVNKAKSGIDQLASNKYSRSMKNALNSPAGTSTMLDALDEAASPTLRGGVNKSKENINAVRNGDVDSAIIGKLPVDYMDGTDTNPNIKYESRIVNNKIMAGEAKKLSVAELAYSTNNYTRSKILEFEKNGKGRLNIVKPLGDKAAVIALEKQPDGNTMVTSIRPQADSNYVRNLQKNKGAKVLYDATDGAATASITDYDSAASRAIADSTSIVPQEGTDVNRNINALERPTGWNGEELSIKKGNVLNRAGNALEQTGENIRNKDINNRLYSKTAEGVYERDSINTLRKLGYEPENYKEAAKVSETVNKFTNDVIPDNLKVKNTNIQNTLTDFEDVPGAINNAKLEDNITKQIIKRIDGARTSAGGTMDEYDVKNLWKGSKELMDLSTSYRKKGMSVNGDVTNPDYVTAADRLSVAAKNMRSIADNEVQWGDSFDKNVLTSRLKNLGASQNDIDYLNQAKDLADLKRRTSVYEDARQMDREIGKSNIRRNAVAGTSTNPVNILTQESGIGEILRTAARPVGKATGAITRKAGQLLNKVGDIASNIGEPVSRVASAATNAATTDSNFPYALVGRLSGTEEAGQAIANPDTYAQPATNLESQLGNTALSTEGNGYTAPTTMTSYGTGTYSNTGYAGTGNNMLDRLVGGMENALNAGDISAFSQLAEIYNTLAKVYGVGSSSSTTSQQKLSATQQRANAAMNSLNRIENMTPDLGYNLSGIPIVGGLATLGGNAYEGEAKSLAQQIGYMVSGSNIKQEEAEAIGKAYVPQPFDSEYTRQLKLQRAREIISQYQNGVAETPTETYAY